MGIVKCFVIAALFLGLPDHCSANPRSSIGMLLDDVIRIQKLGKEKAILELIEIGKNTDSLNFRVFCLCRMLFEARDGHEFRRPTVGAFEFLGGTEYDDWPLEPIAIFEGIPIWVTTTYTLLGTPESAESYISYCSKNCDWKNEQYVSKTDAEIQQILRDFIKATQWKKPLDPGERADLLAQGVKDEQ